MHIPLREILIEKSMLPPELFYYRKSISFIVEIANTRALCVLERWTKPISQSFL